MLPFSVRSPSGFPRSLQDDLSPTFPVDSFEDRIEGFRFRLIFGQFSHVFLERAFPSTFYFFFSSLLFGIDFLSARKTHLRFGASFS